jgi:hypothetical protein
VVTSTSDDISGAAVGAPLQLPSGSSHETAGTSTTTTPAVEELVPKPKSSSSSPLTVDQARDQLMREAKLPVHKGMAEAICLLLRDHDSIKDKIPKLKSLLGRSAKAQREAKVDLEVTQKRLDQALREVERLRKKIDKLANRPTHMVCCFIHDVSCLVVPSGVPYFLTESARLYSQKGTIG